MLTVIRRNIRVHEAHEQIFDDAMDQKARVSKEVYSRRKADHR